MTNHEIFAYKTLCQSFCICSGVVVLAMEVQRFWFTITWGFMVQTLKILTDTYTSRIVRGQSTLKYVIERYFWNGLRRERLKAYESHESLVCLDSHESLACLVCFVS